MVAFEVGLDGRHRRERAVEQARIVDGEQRVDLILTEADPELGRQVQFY